MVIFTIYHFWQDISDFWNTGTFAEGMTNKCPRPSGSTPNIFTDPSDFGYMYGEWITAESTAKPVNAIYFDPSNDGSGIAVYTGDDDWVKMVKFDGNGNNVPGSGKYLADRNANAIRRTNENHIEIKEYYDKGQVAVEEGVDMYLFKKGSKFCSNPTPAATPAAGTDTNKYSKTENNKLCADVGKDPITTSIECKEAAEKLNLTWSNDFDGPGDHPYCLFSNDGRSKVHFNTSNTPGGAIEKYQSLCKNKPAAADAGSGNIELNQPLTNNYAVGTNVQATSSAPRNNVVTTTDDKGNTITTTTQESNRVDANTGAQIQEKCITVSQLHSASQWVDHLFQTLGGTKCANKDKVDTAKNASKMDFIAGVIKGYQKDTVGSHESYMKAINKAQPHLSQAFSGDNLKGEDNNLAQSTTEQISNNSADTQAPVTNDIQAPQQPTWQADQMAQQFSQQQPPQPPQQPQMINGQILPNGFVVEPGTGQCPNGCKYPQYDNKSCEDTIFNGKQYRKCPWVKDGLNGGDCTSCGAILMPKNEHGYARTAPGLFDNVSLDMALKTTDIKGGDGDYYNIGKNFMAQLSKTKNFNLPNTIEPNEYISIGKLIHKYQTERTESSKNTLTNFINDILVTVSLSKDRKINNNSMITAHVAKGGGNFDIDRKKLTGKGVYAYEDAERELASNNRLGGSKSLYEKHISDRARKENGIPRDPRRHPNPYNSLWNVFKY